MARQKPLTPSQKVRLDAEDKLNTYQTNMLKCVSKVTKNLSKYVDKLDGIALDEKNTPSQQTTAIKTLFDVAKQAGAIVQELENLKLDEDGGGKTSTPQQPEGTSDNEDTVVPLLSMKMAQ